MRTGIATIPLDYGKCPPWLFWRMKKLSRSIFLVIRERFGPDEILRRLSDPNWFQALGSVLGFDWNSSGLTTTTLGAIKSGIFDIQDEIGIYICGGKGKTSRKTPDEIKTYGISRGFGFFPYLVFASKMTAKVDSALLQDGYQIYHHTFLFSKNGKWTVVQQGMNEISQSARRYHWMGDLKKEFIQEPHSGIIAERKKRHLNLSAKESSENRDASLKMVGGNFKSIDKDLNLISKNIPNLLAEKHLILPDDSFWPKEPEDLKLFKNPQKIKNLKFNTPYVRKTIYSLTQEKPKDFVSLLSKKGVGPKIIRALSLIGELVYGFKPSYEDPARYSFAHGGKDGVPHPVDFNTYDKTIELMEKGIRKATVSIKEKTKAQRRLHRLNSCL